MQDKRPDGDSEGDTKGGGSNMIYRSLKNWKYELLEGVTTYVGIYAGIHGVVVTEYFTLSNGVLFIYPRYAWDGPSGPTFDTETFMRASLVHDVICQMCEEELIDKKYRKVGDEMLRKICLEDGMSKFRAWYVYNAVRMYSKLKGY
jgi:hypothetical protein